MQRPVHGVSFVDDGGSPTQKRRVDGVSFVSAKAHCCQVRGD